MAVLYLRSRRKIAQLSEVAEYTTLPDAKPKLTREDIEAFIRSDLALASLKSIKERFQSNNVQVYNLLAPEKPGGFIHRLRMEIVMEMKAKGATSSEIAQKTGLSESYVRKIWKKT
jgi:DNA-binding NarL/FixJ family response regulator